MTDLAEYGAGVEPADPPRLERRRIIQSPRTGKIDGCACRDLATGDAVYAARRFPGHHYSSGGGYGISESVLGVLTYAGVRRVLVHESDDDADVFEFWLRQYREGDRVPPGQLHDDRDPERYVPTEQAVHTYPAHAGELYQRRFLDAAREIDWAGFDADHPEREDDDE